MVADIIVAPQTTPAKHGLLASTPMSGAASELGVRWENGFAFIPENCTEPETWVIPCVGPAGGPGPGAPVTEVVKPSNLLEFTPYMLRAQFQCDTLNLRAIDFRARAARILAAGRSKAIETELYTGQTVGVAALGPGVGNLQLTDSTTFTVPPIGGGAPTTPRLGLIQLVQAAAVSASGQTCTLHATPATAMAWWQSGSLLIEGGRLVTAVGGHTVVAGTGYTGWGPDNVPNVNPDEHWAWLTTPVYHLLGEVEIIPAELAEAIDRPENDAEFIAQQTAVAFWDSCAHVGCNIDVQAVLT